MAEETVVIVEPAAAEAVAEELGEAAVEIARIEGAAREHEADAGVQIIEAQAKAAVAIAEAEAEVDEQWLRSEFGSLREGQAETAQAIRSMAEAIERLASLSAPIVLPAEAVEMPPAVEEAVLEAVKTEAAEEPASESEPRPEKKRVRRLI